MLDRNIFFISSTFSPSWVLSIVWINFLIRIFLEQWLTSLFQENGFCQFFFRLMWLNGSVSLFSCQSSTQGHLWAIPSRYSWCKTCWTFQDQLHKNDYENLCSLWKDCGFVALGLLMSTSPSFVVVFLCSNDGHTVIKLSICLLSLDVFVSAPLLVCSLNVKVMTYGVNLNLSMLSASNCRNNNVNCKQLHAFKYTCSKNNIMMSTSLKIVVQ